MMIVCCLPSHPKRFVDKLSACLNTHKFEYSTYQDSKSVLEGKFGDKKKLMLITDIDHLALAKDFLRTYQDSQVALFIGNVPIGDVVGRCASCEGVRLLLADDSENVIEETLDTDLQKLSSGDLLGLQRYFPKSAKIENCTITDPRSKETSLAALEDYLLKIADEEDNHQIRRVAKRFETIADELILNGVFNANPKFLGMHQTSEFEVDSREAPLLQYCYHKGRFGLAVRDPFGALKTATIFHYLDKKRSLQDTMTELRTGLGLKIVFRYSNDVIVNVIENKATEIICLVRTENKPGQTPNNRTSLHIFKKTPNS